MDDTRDAPHFEGAQAAGFALDSVSAPIFMLEPDCKVVSHNTAASALLNRDRACRLRDRRMVFRRAKDTAALMDAVATVAAGGGPVLLRLLGRQGQAILLVRLAAVPGRKLVVAGIADLAAPLPLPEGWTRKAFGFTPQNAKLAEGLADGASLAEFAAATGLPIGTVRTRLKKLLAQTGLSSQATLVGLLLRGAAHMADS